MIKENKFEIEMEGYEGKINDYVKSALEDYVNRGIVSGDFIHAVLQDSLTKSFGYANLENQRSLKYIAEILYNQLPADCWGSKDRIIKWCNFKREIWKFKVGDEVTSDNFDGIGKITNISQFYVDCGVEIEVLDFGGGDPHIIYEDYDLLSIVGERD